MPNDTPMNDALTAPPATGLPLGTIVGGKYRIDGVLGTGGMGVVQSATHLDLDAPVAIKLMREELAKNEEVVARMLFEARAVARMRGAHVVRVLDVGVLDVDQPGAGTPFIVMEQLAGADLASTLIEGGALSPRAAVKLVLQACEGLNEAHALGIVHRDLKPENLFLANTPEGAVLKILDFGVSKDVGTSFAASPRGAVTNAGFAVGSPHYMAPEQMRASLEIDARADIWSLGAILFELVAGKCPFDGDSLPVIYAKVLTSDTPSLLEMSSNAPPELDAIIRRCLEKEPQRRFQSVAELASALRDFIVSEETRAAETQRMASGINLRSGASWAPAPAARSRGWAVPVALLAGVAVAAAAGYAWYARRNVLALVPPRAEQSAVPVLAPLAARQTAEEPAATSPSAEADPVSSAAEPTAESAPASVVPKQVARAVRSAPVRRRGVAPLVPDWSAPPADVPPAADSPAAAQYPAPVPPPGSLPAAPDPSPAPAGPAQDSAPAPPAESPAPSAIEPSPPPQGAAPPALDAPAAPAPSDGARSW